MSGLRPKCSTLTCILMVLIPAAFGIGRYCGAVSAHRDEPSVPITRQPPPIDYGELVNAVRRQLEVKKPEAATLELKRVMGPMEMYSSTKERRMLVLGCESEWRNWPILKGRHFTVFMLTQQPGGWSVMGLGGYRIAEK